MQDTPIRKRTPIIAIVVSFLCISAGAQDLEPRVYANLPKGLNAAAAFYAYAKGNVVLDPALPIADFTISSHNLGLGYLHTFGLGNKLARVQFALPYVDMAGNLKINGRDTSGVRSGFGDMRIRLGINLFGSPALDKKNFRLYDQKTIVGVSLVVSLPTGLYYGDKQINIGANRWAFKPEIGISRCFKHVYAEGYMGVWFYSNNSSFLVTKVLEQKPVLSVQAHLSYYFKNQIWVGINTNWFNGGETSIDKKAAGDLADNWRIGTILSVPFAKYHSIKCQLHTGAFTKSGLDYDVVSIGYQYIFF